MNIPEPAAKPKTAAPQIGDRVTLAPFALLGTVTAIARDGALIIIPDGPPARPAYRPALEYKAQKDAPHD